MTVWKKKILARKIEGGLIQFPAPPPSPDQNCLQMPYPYVPDLIATPANAPPKEQIFQCKPHSTLCKLIILNAFSN